MTPNTPFPLLSPQEASEAYPEPLLHTALEAIVVMHHRGAVRVIASAATHGRRFTAAELRPTDLERWRKLRADLEERQEARRCQTRFRRAPAVYLTQLEENLLQLRLPP